MADPTPTPTPKKVAAPACYRCGDPIRPTDLIGCLGVTDADVQTYHRSCFERPGRERDEAANRGE